MELFDSIIGNPFCLAFMADNIETGRSGLVGPGPTVDRPAGPTENWVGPAGPPLKYSL